MKSTGPDSAAFSLRSPFGRRAIGLSVAAAVGGFLFGFDSSVINGAVDSISRDFALNDVITGFVVAIALVGCAVGAVIAGNLSDRWGRLRVMFLGAIMFFVSSLGAGLAFSAWDLALWRVIGGLGIGIASVVAPAYIAEIAPRQVRGALASLQQLAITIGIFAALLSDALLAGTAGGADNALWFGMEAWRWMFIVGIVPAAVYGLLSFTLPESPRFLISKGRSDEAREVFARLIPADDLDQTLKELKNAIESDRKNAGVSIRGPVLGLQRIVWVGIILSVFQQFVGINVIFYYSTSLWQSVGFEESDSFVISVVTSITNVLVTLVAIFLVDRVGRKPILLTGSVLMTLSLGLMAVAFLFAETGSDGAVVLPAPWGPFAATSANGPHGAGSTTARCSPAASAARPSASRRVRSGSRTSSSRSRSRRCRRGRCRSRTACTRSSRRCRSSTSRGACPRPRAPTSSRPRRCSSTRATRRTPPRADRPHPAGVGAGS